MATSTKRFGWLGGSSSKLQYNDSHVSIQWDFCVGVCAEMKLSAINMIACNGKRTNIKIDSIK